MGEWIVCTRSLTKQYGQHHAVDHVDVHIKKGDIYGFIGRNGAGKTTFLKMICGLAKPTSGEMEIFGYRGDALSKVRSRIGCLIENPGLYGTMSAADNLRLKCCLMGIKKDGYIESLLDLVGLNNVGNKAIKKFSLGMKQRLGIALALVGDPDLLVLDEPINGLDPQGIAQMRDTLMRLNEERNITILISSHILDELSKIATRYGIIHHGALLQELTGEELSNRCNEHITLHVQEPSRAVPVLDSFGIKNYRVVDQEHIHVFERLDESAQLNRELNKAGILVKQVYLANEALEEYFLKLTGGAENVERG